MRFGRPPPPPLPSPNFVSLIAPPPPTPLSPQVRTVVEKFPAYGSLFGKMGASENQLLDKLFYEHEAKLLCLAFEQQFHYAVFYAYVRLREQEVRNIMWVAECVAQNQKARVQDGIVPIF